MYIKSINNVVGYKDLPDGFNIEFNENKTYIVGANFQRKTTVGSLFNWCLTGTSLNGKEKEQVANDTKRVSNVIVDINLDDNKFTIIGKGNKERTNYLNKKTKDALIKYLKIRDNSHDNNKKHNNALFLTFYGYRMSQFTINKIVKRAYRKAELDENVYTVHTLRHTCATLLYRSGVNIKTIQELLGHVHIDTTEIYTHLDNQEVKDVMFEHPLAQFKMEDALAYCA